MQTESPRAITFADARAGERVLHLRVSESTDLLGSAQRERLPGGWEGLIAVSETLKTSGGHVQVLPLRHSISIIFNFARWVLHGKSLQVWPFWIVRCR